MTTQVFGLDLDRRTIAIIVGVVLVGIVGIVAFNVVYPKFGELQALDEQLTIAQTNLDSQTATKASLADVPVKLEKARKTFDNLTALLPREESQSILLIDVARIVKGTGGSLTKFTPGKPAPSTEVPGLANLSKSTSKVTTQGNFAQTLNVLRDLERLEQLLKVEDVVVTPNATKPGDLTTDFNLSSYALPNAAPAAVPVAAAATTDPAAANPLVKNPALEAQPAK